MCPLVSSTLLLLGGGASDGFDDLAQWTADGLEIAPEGGKAGLEAGRAVGRAELKQQADADPAEKCSVEVEVKLGRGERLHRRACVRIARSKIAFARVTVWLSPSPSPSEKKEKLRLECGVVGEAGTRTEDVSDWPATGPERVKLKIEADGDQLTASFGSSSCTSNTSGFDAGADSTRFVIEAGGNGEVVRLDDFSAQWKEP